MYNNTYDVETITTMRRADAIEQAEQRRLVRLAQASNTNAGRMEALLFAQVVKSLWRVIARMHSSRLSEPAQ